jgi:DNA polymerase III alpha subunit
MSRTKMLEEYRVYSSLTDKEQEWVLKNFNKYSNFLEVLKAAAKSKKEGGACSIANRVEILKDKIKVLEHPIKSMNDEPNLIAWTEEKYLGISISCNKIDSCDTSRVNCSCKEYLAGRKGYLMFGVTIQSIREVKVKKGNSAGKTMAFLTISDDTCALSDVCVWADIYQQFAEFLVEGNTVLIHGERDKKGSLIVKEVWQI